MNILDEVFKKMSVIIKLVIFRSKFSIES